MALNNGCSTSLLVHINYTSIALYFMNFVPNLMIEDKAYLMVAMKPDFTNHYRAPKASATDEGFQDPLEICFVVDLSQQAPFSEVSLALHEALKGIEGQSQVRS